MKFVLDENVPASVRECLEKNGHSVETIVDHVARGAEDPIVATISERMDAILVSFDGDFEKIAPKIPKGARQRYRRLSRIWLRCNEWQASQRLEKAMSLIQQEYKIAQNANDKRMNIWISKSYIKTNR